MKIKYSSLLIVMFFSTFAFAQNDLGSFINFRSGIHSGNRVFIHGSAATPQTLLKALAAYSNQLRNVEILAISTLGQIDIAKPEFKDRFYFNSLFVSENIRACINSENGEYIPIFLSEISSTILAVCKNCCICAKA